MNTAYLNWHWDGIRRVTMAPTDRGQKTQD